MTAQQEITQMLKQLSNSSSINSVARTVETILNAGNSLTVDRIINGLIVEPNNRTQATVLQGLKDSMAYKPEDLGGGYGYMTPESFEDYMKFELSPRFRRHPIQSECENVYQMTLETYKSVRKVHIENLEIAARNPAAAPPTATLPTATPPTATPAAALPPVTGTSSTLFNSAPAQTPVPAPIQPRPKAKPMKR